MQFRFSDHTVRVNHADEASLLGAVRERFRSGRGFALATINLDHLVKLHRSASYRADYAAHDLVVADGNPIVWLSRLARKPVSLVPGSDLMRPLLRLAAEENMGVAFYGSLDDVLRDAAGALEREIPGLDVVWTQSPPMGFDPKGEDAHAALKAMQASGARLCIIAISPPRQEAFAVLGQELTPEIGFCSLGASLDFVAGRQTRAPRWVQAIAMEWLWRALLSPRRLAPRYLACLALLPRELLAAWRQRRGTA